MKPQEFFAFLFPSISFRSLVNKFDDDPPTNDNDNFDVVPLATENSEQQLNELDMRSCPINEYLDSVECLSIGEYPS